MTTINCSACSIENDCNSAKCENCTHNLLDSSYTKDDWEDDFKFIEEAELKGEVYELDGWEGFCKLESCQEDTRLNQMFKEEPEIHIQPEEQESENASGGSDTESMKKKAQLTANSTTGLSTSDEESSQRRSRSASPESKQRSKRKRRQKKSPPCGLLKCSQCDETFLHNFELKIHQKQHEGKTIHQCDVCQAVLSNKTILMQHKLKLHQNNVEFPADKYKFQCNFCHERFPLQILLTNHKKTHEENSQIQKTASVQRVDGRLTYICKECGKSSGNKSRHIEHIRVHTKERPFKCELCGMGFTTRGSLTCHARLHTGERTFQCHICELTYRHKRSLTKHLVSHTGEKPFKCRHCNRTFALRTTLSDHERLLHTGETPYECEICGKCFKTSAIQNAHRREEHNIDTNSKRKVEILINNIAPSDSKL